MTIPTGIDASDCRFRFPSRDKIQEHLQGFVEMEKHCTPGWAHQKKYWSTKKSGDVAKRLASYLSNQTEYPLALRNTIEVSLLECGISPDSNKVLVDNLFRTLAARATRIPLQRSFYRL